MNSLPALLFNCSLHLWHRWFIGTTLFVWRKSPCPYDWQPGPGPDPSHCSWHSSPFPGPWTTSSGHCPGPCDL